MHNMINIINTVVTLYIKIVKIINPTNSHHKEKCLIPLILYLYEISDVH